MYDAWMSADEIREGGMVAKLKLGDAVGARKIVGRAVARGDATADALRSLLLDAYLIDACEKMAACKKAARR